MSLTTVSNYSAIQAAPELVLVATTSKVLRLEYGEFVRRLAKDMGEAVYDRLHAAVGVSGEAGELLDAVKKNWVYGKTLETANVVEELGDLEFYMAVMRMLLNVSREDVLQANTDKLSVRYANAVYSDAAAIARADKVATGETPKSYIDGHGQVIAINLTSEQQAAVDETAGITQAPAAQSQESQSPAPDNQSDLSLP